MSILGYSSSYFLPQYWAGTPLYGEKIIPLIDHLLSTDYVNSDKLAQAYFNITNKYKNTIDLPVDYIKEIICENGYEYILNMLGDDEDTIRLMAAVMVLIHEWKSSGLGIEIILNLLKRNASEMVLGVIGNPTIDSNKVVSDFTTNDFVTYSQFSTDTDPFELTFAVTLSDHLQEQCIASCSDYGFSLEVINKKLVLSLGNNKVDWNIVHNTVSTKSLTPGASYRIKFVYTGNEYAVDVSDNEGKKYSNYITVSKSDPLDIHNGRLFLGVDGSTGEIINPFDGSIDLTPFNVSVENIKIEQWFEKFPVGDENTFVVKAELDINLVSSDFFKRFAEFVRRYVYPTLQAFEANLKLTNNLTFIPWVTEKVTYVAQFEDDSVQD